MKAKEYASNYLHATKSIEQTDLLNPIAREAIKEVLNGLIDELQALEKARGAKSFEALYACWVEIENKWKAFCRLVPVFHEGGFKRFILIANPGTKEMFEAFDTYQYEVISKRARHRH